LQQTVLYPPDDRVTSPLACSFRPARRRVDTRMRLADCADSAYAASRMVRVATRITYRPL